MQDAAEPHLAGDVRPATTGGVIRYRIWPARRHPFRTAIAGLLAVAATAGAWFAFSSVLWAGIAFLGVTSTLALFFFPTEVTLDGRSLHMRQFGTPRSWDLRSFRRMEVHKQPVPCVELRTRGRIGPMDAVRGIRLPLPADPISSENALIHVRKWVGRQPTGRFEIDDDHAPEDNVSPRSAQ